MTGEQERKKKVRRLAKPKLVCTPAAPEDVAPVAVPRAEVPPDIHPDIDDKVTLLCGSCGSLIEFNAEKCPLCGAELEPEDTGIVALLEGLTFEDVCSGELDCPSCGDHVALVDGKCTSCGELVRCVDSKEAYPKLHPVIHAHDVVYLHLDVESGDLDYFRKAHTKSGLKQLTVHLQCRDGQVKGAGATSGV